MQLYKDGISHEFVKKFEKDFVTDPLKELKERTFEIVFQKYEGTIGHYYRNIYRIIKMIEDEVFNQNPEENNKEKKNYRGILRAQLSSFELMMIFYNVTYSKKGDKFKNYLMNTNFFDDHLIIDDFIWRNDIIELESIS